jgi:hypothetical protein
MESRRGGKVGFTYELGFFLKRNIILSTHKCPVLDSGTQANARGATHVLARGGKAVPRGSCLSQKDMLVVPRSLPAEPAPVRRTYLIVVLRPVLRPLPAATQHRRTRRRTNGS